MYGVESCVHPDYRGSGVGGRLMDARFALLRRLNLRGMIAGSMIMDYHEVAHLIAPDQYVHEVIAGTRFDTNLSKQIHKGFRPLNLIPNYEHDPRSLNWGVAILWENPDYTPEARKTALILPFPMVMSGNRPPNNGERPAAR
ncbi:MAG: GNAT family N-acetyltransferase [Chloroflexota bacterium]|nr:GNAT family N-acetyltransferase [Chloroflexota bacterium]